MDESFKKKSQSISLADEKAVEEVIAESVLGLWKVVNNLTRLRPSKHEYYRVTIFGSARAKSGSESYEKVKKIAEELGELGCDIITGGGPGLMQAANEGVSKSEASEKRSSIGIRVDLPFEQEAKANPFVTQVYEHGTFFTRLHHFVLSSNAFVIVPGGIGTTLEAMMIWQLLQVKHVQNAPLIFVGDMWRDFLDWTRSHFLKPGAETASPEDLDIPICVDTPEEVAALIRKHHDAWLQGEKL